MKVGKALGNESGVGELMEKRLEDALQENEVERRIADEIYGHGERIIEGPGKRIRLWTGYNAAKAFEPELDDSEIVDSIIPVELIHAFSLVIDDYNDGDKLRRGLPTLHNFIHRGLNDPGVREAMSEEKLGELEHEIDPDFHDGLVDDEHTAESMAVNYAIFLESEAYEWIDRSESIEEGDEASISRILRDAEKKLPRGQIYDLESESLLEDPKAEKLVSRVDGSDFDFDSFYDDVISLKTVPLFVAPVEIAGYISDADSEEVEKAVEAIECTAKAFQIRDDVIDIAEGDIGKDRYSDIREGTLNHPLYKSIEFLNEKKEEAEDIVTGYVQQNGELAEDVIDSYGSPGDFLEYVMTSDYLHDREVEIAGELVQETPALWESNELAREYAEKAEGLYSSLDVEDEERVDSLVTMNWMAATRSK